MFSRKVNHLKMAYTHTNHRGWGILQGVVKYAKTMEIPLTCKNMKQEQIDFFQFVNSAESRSC